VLRVVHLHLSASLVTITCIAVLPTSLSKTTVGYRTNICIFYLNLSRIM